MVKDMISGSLNIPASIPGMERKNIPDEEIAEAPCPLNCGSNARRLAGKYGPFWKCGCSPDVTFRDVGGVPAVREAKTESACPMKGCKGVAVRLVSKKDNRPFWKCAKCSNFFNDVRPKVSRRDGRPEARETSEKKSRKDK